MAKNEIWSIGGGVAYYKEFMTWLETFETPVTDIFQEMYDTHSMLPWNGGKFQKKLYNWSLSETVRRILHWNGMGVHFDLLCTNTLLTPEMIENVDPDVTWMLENLHTIGKNIGVTVADFDLKDYMRSNYPKFRVTASVGYDNSDPLVLDELFDTHDKVCWPLWANNDYELMAQYPMDKLKIVVDTECWMKCPYARPKKHFDDVSIMVNEGFKYWRSDADDDLYSCIVQRKDLVVPDSENTKRMPADMEALRELGVYQFKIGTRTNGIWSLTRKVKEYLGYDNLYNEPDTSDTPRKFRTE